MRYFCLLCMMLAVLLGVPTESQAALSVGEVYTFTLGPGGAPDGANGARGGEFILSNGDITFCVELNEVAENPMKVGSITGGAIEGGLGGGNPDPISTETAYLFNQFSAGVLAKYAYAGATTEFLTRSDAATALQAAIWWFEEEYDNAVDAGKLATAGAFYINLANNNANGGLYGVEVLNNLKGANYDVYAQDFLQVVPEATSIAIWSMLGLMGLTRHRRRSTSI